MGLGTKNRQKETADICRQHAGHTNWLAKHRNALEYYGVIRQWLKCSAYSSMRKDRVQGTRCGALFIVLFSLSLALGSPAGADEDAEAEALNKQAIKLFTAGKYLEAIPVSKKVLRLHERNHGPEHPYTAAILDNLAQLYHSIGDYAKAEPLYQRALAINEKALGPEHPDTLRCLNHLAVNYYSIGDYAKAEPLFQRTLAISRKIYGPEHPTTATFLNNLATVYRFIGEYSKAEPLYQRSLAIREKVLGLNNPDTATSLSDLAVLYMIIGDYVKAEPLYQRALAINEKALGPEHRSTAVSLSDLASLYMYMGDYAKAEPLLQRSLAIEEKAPGPRNPERAVVVSKLATLYMFMGDYVKAEPLSERALAITEKALGPNHPYTIPSLTNLALLYTSMRNYAKAEPLFLRALAIQEKTTGPNHPDTARSLNNLAGIYHSKGDYAKAEPLLQRAMAIREKTLGPEHPDTATSLDNLAGLAIDRGLISDARGFAARAVGAHEGVLANILSFTSEQQRMAYQEATNPFALPATLGSAPDVARTILRTKGVVLDSVLEDRLSAEAAVDPKEREVIEQLGAAKARYTQLLMEVPKDVSAEARKRRGEELQKRARKVEELEGGLAKRVSGLGQARRALGVSVEQVQGALGSDQVLVELLRYEHYLGKKQWETRYGAAVFGPKADPQWVPLGAAAEIAKQVNLYGKSARGQTDEATLHTVLRVLHDAVWVPIEKALPAGARTIILSPDGQLNFISFATLLTTSDEFLIEKYALRYVASGRDLLREREAAAGALIAVLGNPAFGSEATQIDRRAKLVAQNSPLEEPGRRMALEMRDLGGMILGPLPGAEKECNVLVEQAKADGRPSRLFLGAQATEAQLRGIASPRILHLATHGFFLPESKEPGVGRDLAPREGMMESMQKPGALLKNPMHRSGLALAGAQRTLEAWAKGEAPPSENDGIVTAEEVGGLKLKGTWLVVLSACETGIGHAKAGEGVLGLRRGFIQAGAQNLLMTLWPISDETTVQIMLDFYNSRALASGNAAQALLDVQREWLVKLRKEKGLLYAVNRAGPFIMSSQGAVHLGAQAPR
ncbi:MAG TPA: CHAT domain-containing tetratricopeptide repeat protein [Terrimicrobiaceae bacterium]